MSSIVVISGSPAARSRTLSLAQWLGSRLLDQGFAVESIQVRDLDPRDLIYARADAPGIKQALGLVERASGVVIATPVYKAAYTGVLKTFLDLLPQFGLGGKVVLPLATGGTLAHVLAVDYALRPVLHALGARHVVGGLFLLDKLLDRAEDGTLRIESEARKQLENVLSEFVISLRRYEQAEEAAPPVRSSAAS